MKDNEDVNFEWDKNTPEIDFFGENKTEESVVDKVIKDDVELPIDKNKPVKEKPAKKETEEEEQEEEEPDVNFFETKEEKAKETEEEEEEEEQEQEEEESDDPKDKDKKKEKKSKVRPAETLNYLKEKGLIEFELEEGQELTDELAEEILEDDFDARLDGRIEELVADMPEVAGNVFKFIKEGGNVQQYLINLAKQSVSSRITANIDLKNPVNQELVIREQLALEGNDKDAIDAQIEFLKDSNKMSTFAASKYKLWEKKDKEDKEALLIKQRNANLLDKENTRKLKEKVADLVKDKENIGSLKLTKNEKKELPTYMTEKNVKLENGAHITTMQKDLYEALQDDHKAIMIAKLLKSNFDFTAIENAVEDKVAKKTKEELQRHKNTPSKSGKSGSPKKRGSLADYF
jgi:hypothetical protein